MREWARAREGDREHEELQHAATNRPRVPIRSDPPGFTGLRTALKKIVISPAHSSRTHTHTHTPRTRAYDRYSACVRASPVVCFVAAAATAAATEADGAAATAAL